METIREYAAERLAESGETEEIEIRHCRYFTTMAETAHQPLHGPEQDAWVDRLERELGNLAAAMDHALEMRNEFALRLAGNLRWFWLLYGASSEGRRWARRALDALPPSKTAERGLALLASGSLALMQGELHAARWPLEEAVRIFRQHDMKKELGEALGFLSNALAAGEDPEAAEPLVEESLAVRLEAGDQWGLEHVHMTRGIASMTSGNYQRAREEFQGAIEVSRSVGDTWTLTQALNHLGDVARCEADYVTAERLYRESLASITHRGREGLLAALLHNLGYVAQFQRELDVALDHFRESLAMFRRQGDRRGILEAMNGVAGVLGLQGDVVGSARLFGAAEALMEQSRISIWPSNLPDYRRTIAMVRSRIDETAFIAYWRQGRKLSIEQALTLADPDHPG
jgi:tetratricopeptide (TPR) repeat protein